ncbi:MAG: RNA polymerase sigma factor [Deltaproteobacteria bacterium]|nr:RNA polymerase sigma factor [Deltaproteobacteria bacterium]
MTRSEHARRVSRFVELTRPYHDRLFRIAITICGDRDLAADLSQEALVRAFNAFDRFEDGRPVLPWLTRILRNVYLDTFKTSRAKHEVRVGGDRDVQPFASVPSPTPNPLQLTEQREMQRILASELGKLDPAHQLVINLCEMEGMSYQEAADAMEVPIGTVRSRLARARDALRQRIIRRLAQG